MRANPAPFLEGADYRRKAGYARFLTYVERRRRIAEDLVRPQPPTADADIPPLPNHPPAPVSTVGRH